MSIRIALFGQPRVVSADGSRDYPLQRKTLNLLAYLVLNRDRPAMRDSVAFTLFPDEDEEKARSSLRRNLSYLLSALPDGKQFVVNDGERLAWNTDAPAHVDVVAFEQAVRAGNDEAALAEYAGQLLPTLYDEWTSGDRERLRDAFHDVLLRSIARERSRRRFDAAAGFARRLLDEDPWREDVVRHLMAIRYDAGDRAGALAAFERFATRLHDEMQADPMPETLALRDAILRGARLASSEPQRHPPVASTTDIGLPFVGRDAAMQRARECWHAAADGRSGVLLVAGEAGAGKSRFATELARLIESEGGAVLRGYTPAGGEHRPYEAFVEALDGTPELLDDQMNATLTDDRAARLRLFDSVRERLRDLARRRVLALVLEDLHWAGAATIDLLEFVVRRLEHDPILIVATFRDDELPRAHPLRALRRDLQGRGSATELSLERLNEHDAAAAMRAALPEAAAGASAIAVAVARAGGVPLLLDESMRDLAAGRASNASDIATLVDERFARVSSDAETILVFGALLGERFELGTLVAVSGWREGDVLEAIGEGIEHGLLRATARAPGLAFAFRHDLIREAALERIAAPERARAHGLIARALGAQLDASGARAGQIARHFSAAGEPLRASAYYLPAARYALTSYANEEAIALATAGLESCDDAAAAQRRLRYDLLQVRELGLARIGAVGRRRNDARALVALAESDDLSAAAWERVFEASPEDATVRAEALHALSALARVSPRAQGTFLYLSAKDANIRGDYAAARDAATAAAGAFEAAGELRSAMLARFALLTSLKLLAENGEAARVIDEVRPRMDASDDLPMRAEFHRVASSALFEMTRYSGALDDARSSLSFALRIGDRYAEARARQNVAVLSARVGDYEASFVQQERAMAAYREVGSEEGVADSIINLAAWRLYCGDFSSCARLLESFGTLEGHTPLTQLKFVQLQAGLHVGTGQSDGESRLREARQRADALKAAAFAARMSRELAKIATAQGRFDEAAVHIDAALAGVETRANRLHEATTLALSARVRAALGDARRAREDAHRAMSLATGEFVQTHSEIAWNAASAHALLGDAQTAMQLAESAVAAAVREALGMPPDLSETFLALPWHQDAVAYLWGRTRSFGA